MIPASTAAAAFLLVIATLVGYLIAAREGRRRPVQHPDDYFLARSRMTSDDFGDAQVSYALQMSTIYPFFILAAGGDWLIPVLNSVFWFLGILFFYLGVRAFKPFLGQSRTIHAFIAEANESPALRRVSSALTIIAFAGVILFEIVYGASVFRVIFGDNRVIYYLIVSFLAAYLTTYIWNGGQMATMRTDQFQLLIAYLGLHFAIAYMFGTQEVHAQFIVPTFIPFLVLAASVIMLFTRTAAVYRAVRARRPIITAAYIVILSSLLTLIAALAVGVPSLDWTKLFVTDPSFSRSTSLDFWLMVGAAVLIPVFWQFVDLTNWQRICSLSATTPEEYAVQTRKGLLSYLVESPLSWLLAVLLGLTAPQVLNLESTSVNSFEAFIRHFLAQPGLAQVIGIFLVAGIVGIFMSTADSGITALGYAFAYDFWKPTRALIDKQALSTIETETVVAAGRWFMAVVVGIIILVFIVLDWAFRHGQTFIGLLFSFYTPIISLSPAVLCPIWFKRRPKKGAALLAILLGAVTGLVCGICSALGYSEVQWVAAPAAFVISWSAYLFGYVFGGETLNLSSEPEVRL